MLSQKINKPNRWMMKRNSLFLVLACLMILSGVLAVVAKHRPSYYRPLSNLPAEARSGRISETESLAKVENRSVLGELSMRQLDREQFQVELANLNNLALSNDLKGLLIAADEIEKKWGEVGGEYYGQLMLNVSNLLVNSFNDENNYSLSQKYAFAALAKADTFSLELEVKILPFLSMDMAPRMKAGDIVSEWAKERSIKAKLWLHAWLRLEREIDRNFNFDDRPSLNIRPPDGVGAPSGVAPEAIKDPKLRAQYEAALSVNREKVRKYDHQYMLHYIDKMFPPKAEQYLIRVYSMQPFNTDELKGYLNTYISKRGRRESILSQVEKNISTNLRRS